MKVVDYKCNNIEEALLRASSISIARKCLSSPVLYMNLAAAANSLGSLKISLVVFEAMPKAHLASE